MARPLRIEYPGAFYHVISRGNARQKIFVSDGDKHKFLSLLETGVAQFGYRIHVYCLMDNHYHLLMETANANLSKILHRLNSGYSTFFSRKYHRSGHLLQGRAKVLLVDKDAYALELSRYIHLNPVKAGVVKRPEVYRWSSCKSYFKKLPLPDFLETSFLLGQLDKREAPAREAMRAFVEVGRTGRLPNPFKDLKGGVILGDDAFVQWVDSQFLKGRKKDRDLPGLRELKRLDLGEIRDMAEHGFQSNLKVARKAGIYLCRKFSERTLAEIGEFFGGIGVSAVSETFRRLEVQRQQDKHLDRQLSRIEKKIKNV
ncbi:MAG: transposase [bacterium]|nr:transposase [bacterium]